MYYEKIEIQNSSWEKNAEQKKSHILSNVFTHMHRGNVLSKTAE